MLLFLMMDFDCFTKLQNFPSDNEMKWKMKTKTAANNKLSSRMHLSYRSLLADQSEGSFPDVKVIKGDLRQELNVLYYWNWIFCVHLPHKMVEKGIWHTGRRF
jgi:hypothetical protein